ncbi:MAG: hypothetical protein K6C95_03965 [Lachnospiraceae bacterium]|nr:hypothetical protein [Lachnospiraceae bacterium]
MQIPNFQNDTRKFVDRKENFYILEYQRDASVSPEYAPTGSLYAATNSVSAKAAARDSNTMGH